MHDEETTIWEGGPSPAAYAGPIALGALLLPAFRIGTVNVVANDPTTPSLAMPGIANPETVKETIRTAYRRSRRAEGVRVGERMVE